MSDLSHASLAASWTQDQAWKLLRADNAPLILSFAHAAFRGPAARFLPEGQALEQLEDFLTDVRASYPGSYQGTVQSYISSWCASGYFRRLTRTVHAGPQSTPVAETVVEPTAALERALRFTDGLSARDFVGTASRLRTVRELFSRIATELQTDPAQRIAELQAQRDALDARIDAVRRGEDLLMDDTQVRESYQQVSDMARALLADLRSVEDSFADLVRSVRQRAVSWTGSRGEFLDTVFGTTQQIGETDQGRSWDAFREYLGNVREQRVTEALAARVEALPALQGRTVDLVRLLRDDLFEAAEETQSRVAILSAQLARFLSESDFAQARAMKTLLRETLSLATLAVDAAAQGTLGVDASTLGMEIEETRLRVALPMERPLWTPSDPPVVEDDSVVADAADAGADLSALFDLTSVDVERLRSHVEDALAVQPRIGLDEVVSRAPLELGLEELLGYFSVAGDGVGAYTAVATGERMRVSWDAEEDITRAADMPGLMFVRGAGQAGDFFADLEPASEPEPATGPDPDLPDADIAAATQFQTVHVAVPAAAPPPTPPTPPDALTDEAPLDQIAHDEGEQQ